MIVSVFCPSPNKKTRLLQKRTTVCGALYCFSFHKCVDGGCRNVNDNPTFSGCICISKSSVFELFQYLGSGKTGDRRRSPPCCGWFPAALARSGTTVNPPGRGKQEWSGVQTQEPKERIISSQQARRKFLLKWFTLCSPLERHCPLSLSLFLSSDWRFSPRTDVWRMTEASLGRGGTTGGVSS